MSDYVLIAANGAGSMIVEAGLELSGMPYRLEIIPYDAPGPERDRLLTLNPLGQFPTLIMPDGAVMTESAAILLHLGDVAPSAGLAPPADAPERAAFLRWLEFIVAAIYPTFTYGDVPGRWVSGEAAQRELVASTDRHREALWRYLDGQVAPNPWFLGERFSCLDLYIGAMVSWRPRQAWFRAECPKLASVYDAVRALPKLAEIWRRNID
jgi:GST-like protein